MQGINRRAREGLPQQVANLCPWDILLAITALYRQAVFFKAFKLRSEGSLSSSRQPGNRNYCRAEKLLVNSKDTPSGGYQLNVSLRSELSKQTRCTEKCSPPLIKEGIDGDLVHLPLSSNQLFKPNKKHHHGAAMAENVAPTEFLPVMATLMVRS